MSARASSSAKSSTIHAMRASADGPAMRPKTSFRKGAVWANTADSRVKSAGGPAWRQRAANSP